MEYRPFFMSTTKELCCFVERDAHRDSDPLYEIVISESVCCTQGARCWVATNCRPYHDNTYYERTEPRQHNGSRNKTSLPDKSQRKSAQFSFVDGKKDEKARRLYFKGLGVRFASDI